MARFKHRVTGSTVSVADEKADRFGPEWEPINDEPKAKASAKPSDHPRKS